MPFLLFYFPMLRFMLTCVMDIYYVYNVDLIRLKDVLGLHGPKSPPCTIIQLDQGNDYRSALKKIYYSTEPHIILSVEPHKIADILNQARDIHMLDEYKSYIIISLDAHTIDLTKGSYISMWEHHNRVAFVANSFLHNWKTLLINFFVVFPLYLSM